MHTKIRMYFQHFSLSFCNESLLKLIQLDIIIHTKFYSTERNTFQLKCVHTLYDRYTRNGTLWHILEMVLQMTTCWKIFTKKNPQLYTAKLPKSTKNTSSLGPVETSFKHDNCAPFRHVHKVTISYFDLPNKN